MLDLGATPPDEPGEETMAEGTSGISARKVLLTLVPNSAIQFLDLDMSEEAVAHTRRRYIEDHSDGSEPSLHPTVGSDGLAFHPVTNQPCKPEHAYTVGGVDALAPFLDTWLPLPFMRVSRRPEDDGLALDEGPSNWTRVYLSRIDGAAGAGHYRVVLAIDTAIEAQAAPSSRVYAAPTLEDLRTDAAFRYSDDVADVAWFVSEAWVDDWIRSAFEAGRQRAADTGNRHAAASGALEHLARYLTLLSVLKEACDLPALRFMEPNAVGAYAEPCRSTSRSISAPAAAAHCSRNDITAAPMQRDRPHNPVGRRCGRYRSEI